MMTRRMYTAGDGRLTRCVLCAGGLHTSPSRVSPPFPDTQDRILRFAVDLHDGKNWKSIAAHLESRTDVQCLHRWQKVLRPGLIKGPWTKEVGA